MKGAALAGLSAALLNAGSAQAAMEVANIAAGDNRFGTIATLAVPVVGVSIGCCAAEQALKTTRSEGVVQLRSMTHQACASCCCSAVGGLQHSGPPAEPAERHGSS
jgi:hypothetical protein